MKLLQKTSQHRRDFYGDYQCEGCLHVEKHLSGYDDRNFHDNVTPEMKCVKCGESTNSLGLEKEIVSTKYADHEVV